MRNPTIPRPYTDLTVHLRDNVPDAVVTEFPDFVTLALEYGDGAITLFVNSLSDLRELVNNLTDEVERIEREVA